MGLDDLRDRMNLIEYIYDAYLQIIVLGALLYTQSH